MALCLSLRERRGHAGVLQVCALQWSRHEREILSSHGFSQNQLCLWKYPSMAKVAEMSGHTSRVLHLAQSPDGTAVCSAAADETLRFWKCFAEAAPQQKARAYLHFNFCYFFLGWRSTHPAHRVHLPCELAMCVQRGA